MAEENKNAVKEEVPDIVPFDRTKKKKKKKVVIRDSSRDSVDKLADKTENLAGSLSDSLPTVLYIHHFCEGLVFFLFAVSDGQESAFSGLKKKKKKPVESSVLNEEGGDTREDLDDGTGDDEEGEGIVLGASHPWEGSDRDYHYEELLGRVFNILRENNPELAGDRRRTTMRPPQVLREGTKKTVFVNFMDLCGHTEKDHYVVLTWFSFLVKVVFFCCLFEYPTIWTTVNLHFTRGLWKMHRQPDHVMAFLLAELGTSGSLDGQQRLVVKGRFAPKNFEGILRRYVNEYVICIGCKSPDTILSKENRLFFLRCEKCGSGRSVAPIKAGFVARVGRRNAGA
ncbi:putative translation initiation factor 2, beta subunit [Rosa chinensis]|uniref:Eukaryotic translation initiation factor 2 subunit beta n=1 Tax=Rosa chinensis TaxID=74649 RepID=A0A2P6QKY4_ROSCH|nr:putative translation initiation factor 2, beta subunit [Rosa chinensis]